MASSPFLGLDAGLDADSSIPRLKKCHLATTSKFIGVFGEVGVEDRRVSLEVFVFFSKDACLAYT